MRLIVSLLIFAIMIVVCGCDTQETTVKNPDGDTINLKFTHSFSIDYYVDMIVTKPTGRSVRFHGSTDFFNSCGHRKEFGKYTHETTQIANNLLRYDMELEDYAEQCYLYALTKFQGDCPECAAKDLADHKAVRELFDDAPMQAAPVSAPTTASVDSSWFVTSSGK